MLSGIKTGKKKKKKASVKPPPPTATAPVASTTTSTTTTAASSDDANAQIAALLRQNITHAGGSDNDDVIGSSSNIPANRQAFLKEAVPLGQKNEEDWTLAELVAAEKLSSSSSQSQRDRSNVMRHFKHHKRKTYVDSDEEEEDQVHAALGTHKKQRPRDQNKVARREDARQQRQVWQQNRQLQAALDKSWWWLESQRFAPQRLLARGRHVSLVWAPPLLSSSSSTNTTNSSTTNNNNIPQHLYLVPTQPATSFRLACGKDDEAWKELLEFQASLRRFYDRLYDWDVVFAETVLDHNSYWQAKMEVFVTTKDSAAVDVPMYVRQALAEQGYEPHQLAQLTAQKTLLRSVPPNFPYLYIQYAANRGAVQVLQNHGNDSSSKFPHAFWPDLFRSLTAQDQDDVLFARSRGRRPQQQSTRDDDGGARSKVQEQEQIQAFCRQWQNSEFDGFLQRQEE